MGRDEVITRLQENREAICAMGVAHLHLYGSHARNEARTDSDIDLFFDRDPNKRLGLFELVELKMFLEELLGRDVDVGTRTSLHHELRADIESSATMVF